MDVVSLGFRTDLALLRLGGSIIDDRGDHLVVRSPLNPTFWWGNFLLLPTVPPEDEVDGWVARFAAEFPLARHVAIGFDAKTGELDDLAAFADRGFETEASTVLAATWVHPPAHPNRTTHCRPLVSDGDWEQSVELSARCNDIDLEPAAYREFSIARAATERGLVESGDAAWFGAFVDDRLVSQLGIVSSGDGLARYQSVETDPEFRQQGLAGTLVHHAAEHANTEFGAHTLVIVADPDYVAIRVYRSLGFLPLQVRLQAQRRPPVTIG